MELLSGIIFTIIGFLSFGMAIFFPNLFLITFSQLLVAYHLHLEDKTGNHGFTDGAMLRDYMGSIPDGVMMLLEKEYKCILGIDVS